MYNSENSREKTAAYRQEMISKAEELIADGLPKRIQELNKILERKELAPDQMRRYGNHIHQNDILGDQLSATLKNKLTMDSSVSSDTESNEADTKLKLTEVHHSNPAFKVIMDTLQEVTMQIQDDTLVLQMWISLLRPKMEDGNNTGVAIQHEICGIIADVRSGLIGMVLPDTYHHNTAETLKRLLKYPGVEDYKMEIQRYDESTFVKVRNEFRLCLVR